MTLHIAQFNNGRLRAEQDDPAVAGFMDALDEVNAAGEAAPGFVWRHQDESGAATSTFIYDDQRIIINYTIWESIEQLRDFAYRGSHLDYFRRRLEWFEEKTEASHVMWWIPEGETPPPEEGKRRLEYLQANGPTEAAFGFADAKRFEPVVVPTISLDS